MIKSETYSLVQIASIVNGKLCTSNPDQQIRELITDSRKVLFPATSLFFAIDGQRRSGASFISELYERGVRAFVITDRDFDISEFPFAAFIFVENVIMALQALAASHRALYSFPVIGITGSNGKTIVKEWLFQLLQEDFNIVRSPKSFNSQIGVPLSVWEINENNDLGIFEAGISLPQEMAKLENIIKPTIGIFTNFGDAHNEGFVDPKEKLKEKLSLFKNTELIIYCRDYLQLDNEIHDLAQRNSNIRIFSWSKNQDASLQVLNIEKRVSTAVMNFRYASKSHEIILPFTDDASIENLINCISLLLSLNYTVEKISARIQFLQPVEMRLQLRQGINNCSIIDDSYSADLSSLSIALDFLLQQKQHQKHTLIISDILQSGIKNEDLYSQLAEMLKKKNINRLIAVGPLISANDFAFDSLNEKIFFNSTIELKDQFHRLHFHDETILLKGARVFQFEDISAMLQQKTHQTVLEIDLQAMSHNLKEYQQLLHPGTRLMVMVKASGYGSGTFEIASLLQFHKVDYLAVAYTDEGVELRKAGISLPIMVMNPEEGTFEALTIYDLEPELFSFRILQGFADYLRRSGIPHYPVHIKLDTGMHRLGFQQPDIDQLSHQLLHFSELKIQSVFSHLAASDDPSNRAFTIEQASIFQDCCSRLKDITGYHFLRHIANSSGISQHPDLHFDMVRLGIGIYGVDANPLMQTRIKNVTTLKTTIAQVKSVKAGDTVGYGKDTRLEKDSIIATVRIGYADGYPRILGNGKGKMLIAGKLVPVVGNVCMDMTMLDITGVNDVAEGDEVLVFGNELSISKVAANAGTIAYEIMTGISQRVKRVYFE